MNKLVNRATSDEAIRWFSRIQSDQFSELEEKKFLAWLNQSPENQVAYLEVEQLWSSTARLEIKQKNGLFNWSMPLAAGAFACCALFAVFLVQSHSVKTFDYQTAIGEQKSIQLEDGSQLQLNTNTHLQVTYSKTQRKIILESGETYFDVARNPDRPFDVITSDGQVRVLGTHFSVRKLESDTQVSVVEGRVGVGESVSDSSAYQAKINLDANQSITMSDAKKGASPQTINTDRVLAWKNNQLVFQNQTLGEVATELQRYFPKKIVIQDSRLNEIRMTGVLQLGQAEQSFERLCSSFNLICRIDKQNNQVVIDGR